MWLLLPLSSFREDEVVWTESVPNTLVEEGRFTRLMYSTPEWVMGSVYVSVVSGDPVWRVMGSRWKEGGGLLDCPQGPQIVAQLEALEATLLGQGAVEGKEAHWGLTECIRRPGSLRATYATGSPTTLVLRISGVWETRTQFGLTFKFLWR
jgi:hypothetical protein